MSIQVFEHPLAQGIRGLGSSLGDALDQQGQRAFKQKQLAQERGFKKGLIGEERQFKREETADERRYKEGQEEEQRGRQFEQLSALAAATQVASQTEGDWYAKNSAFNESLQNAGIPIDPQLSLNYMKAFGDVEAKKQKAGERTPVERQTFKENQKLTSGMAADAKTAKALYKDIDILTKAIESPQISGPGLKGNMKRAYRWMTSAGQPGDEQTLETLRKNAIFKLGDLKGIRITDTKLRFLEESLFNPKKSKEANREALRIYRDTLEKTMSYPQRIEEMMSDDPEALYDPTFSIRLEDITPQGIQEASVTEQDQGSVAQSFAERVRARGKKK